MMNLDDTGALRAGDPSGMLGHLEGFPEQLERALEIGRRATLTLSGRGARAVVVAGMGGSAIGGEIAAAHLAGSISVPMIVVRNYEMPAFVGADTVVVAASYSGNTEETLAAYRDAHARGARVLCVTTGGELAARAADDGHDVIAIPGGLPPRAALGYGLVPLGFRSRVWGSRLTPARTSPTRWPSAAARSPRTGRRRRPRGTPRRRSRGGFAGACR